MSELDLAELREYLRKFAADRDWEKFHTPKNLAMAVAAEAGELLEVLQWVTPEESAALSGEQKAALADEIVDVLVYLVTLADRSGIALASEVWRKLRENEARYDPRIVKGSAGKR